MSEPRRHVLIWVAPEFLKSSGMIQLFTEASIFVPPQNDLEEYIRSAEAAGGFALTGRLAEVNHGAGIWISPVTVPGLELMIPWHLVRSVVTAENAESSKAFGLMSDLAQPGATTQTHPGRSGARDDVK
jgi:hypothetical protein